MGGTVHKEFVNDPTCGQMFDTLRNIQEYGEFSGSSFYIQGFEVARLVTGDVCLNGISYPNMQLLYKKPVKEGLPKDIERLIGRRNGISLINNIMVGLEYVDGNLWIARRELIDSDLLIYFSGILCSNYVVS